MPTSRWIALSSTCICSRSLRSRAPRGSSRSSTLGPVHQGPGEGDALALPTGELGRPASAEVPKPYLLERLHGAGTAPWRPTS